MSSVLDKFLAKEESRKYHLLRWLERSSYFALTRKEIMDHLEISNYVLKTTIEQLVQDLERYGLVDEIQVYLEDPFVQLKITGTASSETLLERYVEESISFQILLGATLKRYKSLNELSERLMISYPIVHSAFKKMNQLLVSYGIKIDRKFCLVGENERNIRLFLTELFTRIYRTSDSPIPYTKKITVPSERLKMQESIQQAYYFQISELRIRQENYLTEDIQIKITSVINQSDSIEALLKLVPKKFKKNEQQALLLYCSACEPILSTHIDWTSAPEIKNQSERLLVAIEEAFPLLEEESIDQEAFLEKSNHLHLHFVETSEAYEELQSEVNIYYFQENFPQVVSFCRQYVAKLCESDPKLFKRKKHIFFQYLLLILNYFPREALIKTVNVCVDFSYGVLYNRFIEENLSFFNMVGAKIVSDIRTADLLLTDSRDLGKQFSVDSIVWLAPPRPLDWANLGQKIVEKRS